MSPRLPANEDIPRSGRQMYLEHMGMRSDRLEDQSVVPQIGIRERRLHWGEQRGRGGCLPQSRLSHGGMAALGDVASQYSPGPRRAKPPPPPDQLGSHMTPVNDTPATARAHHQEPANQIGIDMVPLHERALPQRSHIGCQRDEHQVEGALQDWGGEVAPIQEFGLGPRRGKFHQPLDQLGPHLEPLREAALRGRAMAGGPPHQLGLMVQPLNEDAPHRVRPVAHGPKASASDCLRELDQLDLLVAARDDPINCHRRHFPQGPTVLAAA